MIRKPLDFTVELELIKCLKAFMNNKVRNTLFMPIHEQSGLKETLALGAKSIETMALCLVSENFFVRKIAQELITVISYSDAPRGHSAVLSALEKIKTLLSEPLIHTTWTAYLRACIDSKASIGGGSSGGIVAGVGWVGETKVTDKDIMDYLVRS
jgi:cytokinesis protein